MFGCIEGLILPHHVFSCVTSQSRISSAFKDNEAFTSADLWRLRPSHGGHFHQLLDRTANEMKSNSLQSSRVVLMEPFKSRTALVSENMASTPADVISQLLPPSKRVPPPLSESQRGAFLRSQQLLDKELFEAAASPLVLL